MKSFTIKNIMGLLSIILVLCCTLYFTVINFKYPLVGIEVMNQNDQLMVKNIYEKGWANEQPIEEGDIIKLVNGGSPEDHSTVSFFNRIEKAESITIKDKDLQTKTYSITYDNLIFQYVLYLLLPLFFSMTMISLGAFLYRKKKEDRSAIILIYFLLSIGVCYFSATTSARGDIIGRVSLIITLPGSIVLFIHFLKSYFLRYNLVFIKTKSIIILYTICCTVLLAMSIIIAFDGFNILMNTVLLGFFLFLIIFLLYYLTRFYLQNKNTDYKGILKIIWLILFSAFSPFLFLYAIPAFLFNKELVSAEVTAIFLLFIPFVFVYLQLAEKLFDIEFLLNRLRYYSLLSFPFTIFILVMLKLILKIDLLSIFSFTLFLLLFTGTALFLYTKEYLDYKMSHHLFSQKSDFESSLYKFFQKAKDETKVDSLIKNLMNEIRDVLMVEKVVYIEMVSEDDGEHWLLKNRENYLPVFAKELEMINWNHCRTGSLIEIIDGFGIAIGGDYKNKNIIFCGLKNFKTTLNIQERIWLETLAYISSILLENFQLIEGLFQKLEDYKEKNEATHDNYPSWLSRLLFTISEKERANLSIDLHDSVLQDLLQLLRVVDNITEKVDDPQIKVDLFDLKESMLDNIHLIRETCNELRPPFLSELGIIESIQLLFDQTKLRSNFMLNFELDPSIQMINKEYELPLYRVVQELLNNAMKHSEASVVNISLTQPNQNLVLLYQDNGIGMNMTKLKDSFKTIGLSGIKERIKSISGTMEINSTPDNGMNVLIEIKTGSDDSD
jgi:two-component system, NarL family, sensor histidine kinase ComP